MNPAGSHDDDAATALRGASLAFSKKPPVAPPPKKDNGALTAATSAGRAHSPARLGVHSTGGSVDDAHHHHIGGGGGGAMGVVSARLQQLHPQRNLAVDPKSPSFIAATLAASRSASPSPVVRTPRRIESVGGSPEHVDSMPIAPTGSLISMFEKGKAGDPIKMASPQRSSTENHGDESPVPVMRTPTARYRPQLQTSGPPRRLSAESTEDSLDEESAEAKTPTAKIPPKPLLKPSPRRMSADLSDEQLNRRTPARTPITQPKPKAQPAQPSLHTSLSDVKDARSSVRLVTRARTPVTETKPKPQIKTTPRRHPVQPAAQSPPRVQPTVTTMPIAASKPKPKPRPLTPPAMISRSTPEVLSPKPIRLPSLHSKTPPQIAVRKPTLQTGQLSPDPRKHSPKQSQKQRQRPPTPPQPRNSGRGPTAQPLSHQKSFGGGQDRRPVVDSRAVQPLSNRPKSSGTVSSEDSFVSASSTRSPVRLSPPPLPRRAPIPASAPSSPTRELRRHRPTNSSTSTLPLNSLTSAIMAGSLASSRLTPHNTGSSLPPIPPLRHKSPRLLQTLRQPHHLSDDETDRHKKGHLRKLHSGKHAHHEGARKKWRDEITSRERKRYEAVWASNRGLLIPQLARDGGVSELVSNVVVREIWKRSRLPDDELIEVWDVVDRDGRGALGRQAFVVGMWLVDQRLRGRKIPSKVSESVWGSAANGVRVKKPKLK